MDRKDLLWSMIFVFFAGIFNLGVCLPAFIMTMKSKNNQEKK
jgi:hypothetical protein